MAQGRLAAGQRSAILFFVPEGPSVEQYPLGESHLLSVSNCVVVSLGPNANEIKTLNHPHNVRVPLDILTFTPFVSLKLLITMYLYLLMSLLYPPHYFNSIVQKLGEPSSHICFTHSTQQEPNTLRVLIKHQLSECCPGYMEW